MVRFVLLATVSVSMYRFSVPFCVFKQWADTDVRFVSLEQCWITATQGSLFDVSGTERFIHTRNPN